jgi:hypothetical protein
MHDQPFSLCYYFLAIFSFSLNNKDMKYEKKKSLLMKLEILKLHIPNVQIKTLESKLKFSTPFEQ